jgi:hypothetical protein
MNANINESISHLAVDVDFLIPLPGNPRVGNVEAIAASYAEFGQVKPIVIRPNDDGTSTVIAGNHQLLAAKRLGWSHIAAVEMDADDKRALAFAMADNRSMELGHTDGDLLNDILSQISDDYSGLLDGLGWDDFELAAINESSLRVERNNASGGYVTPVMQALGDIVGAIVGDLPDVVHDEITGESRIVAPAGSDHRSIATQGSTSINQSGSDRAVVQYTLVFDNTDQQRKWYSFIRWLKTDAGNDGDTIAERIINFLESHADF